MSETSCDTMASYAREGRRGRLDDAEAEALAAHLSTCPRCRELHRRECALDGALGRLTRPAAPEALKARLQMSIARETADARPSHVNETARKAPARLRTMRWMATMGLLMAAAALPIFFRQQEGLRQAHALLANEAVSDHLRVLYADRGLEVDGGGIHQVKPWFEGRLDFAPVLAFDGDEEFPLLGGSVAYFHDRKAAAFAFRHKLHHITLLVFPADGLTDLPSDNVAAGHVPGVRVRLRGFDALLWRHQDLGYALVSDMTGSELERLASKIATSK